MEQEEVDVRAELEALEKELAGEPVAPVEAPVEPVVAEPVKEEEPFDVKQAAKDVFARLSRDEQIEWLKERGLDAVDPKKVAADEQAVATGAAKLTAQSMLKALDSRVSAEELSQIEGYDDLDESQQILIKADLAAEKRANEIYEKATERQRQHDATQQLNAELDYTAQTWAKELETPDAAQVGREYLGQFGPDTIALYKRQSDPAYQGPRDIVKMVQEGFKAEVEKFKAAKVAATPQEDPPKAEPAGGKETYGGGNSEADGLAEYLAQKPEFANDKAFLEEVRSMTV